MKSTFELPVFRSRLFCLLAVSFSLTLSHLANAASFFWTGASGVDTNWSTPANWSANSGSPGAADTAVFTITNASGTSTTINNAINVNTTVTALINTNTTTGTWHVTDIPAGLTLTATNVTLGGNFAVNGLQDNVAMTDGGTLAIYGNLTTGVSGSSSVNNSTVDFSGLSNFVYNAPGGTIGSGAFNRSFVTFRLAAISNDITAGTINSSTASSSSTGSGNISLGSGTNIINVGTFNIAAQRGSSSISFPADTGGLRIRGTNGTDALANITLGNRTAATTSGGTTTGSLNLTNHQVDLRLGTLTVGQSSAGPTVFGVGVVRFDQGQIFASNITAAVTTGTGSSATGTITVNTNAAGTAFGTLVVGSGGFSMVNAGGTTPTNTGNLVINGGSVLCSNNIFKTTSSGTASVTNNNGTLTMLAGTTVGTSAIPIDNIVLSGASLHLNVDGNSSTAIISGNTVSASSTIITLDSVANVVVPKAIPLISYNPGNGDPFSGFSLPVVPPGYIATLVDNTVNDTVDLNISPNVSIPSLVWRGAVGSVLNSTWDKGTTANWLNGASPSTYADPDLVHFDDTASNSTVTVSTQVGPGVLTITNNSRNYTFNGSGAITGAVDLVKAGSGSLVLTESGGDSFSLGVDVFGGTVILDGAGSSISGGASVSGGATLQIGNNDANGNLPAGAVVVDGSLVFKRTDNVLVSTAISGSGSLTQQGAGKLTLSAVNQYTGNTAVLQGTLALTVANAISNSPNVNVNGAGLDVSVVTATTILNNLSLVNAGVTLVVTDSITPISVSSLSLGGAGNTITVTSLPPVASYPTTFKLIQSSGAINGAFNVTVSSLPAGFVGTAIASGDNTAVLLKLTSGPVGVRPSVGWVGNNFVTTTTNWSDAANWQLPGAPVVSDNVIFTSIGAVSGSPFNSVGDGHDGLNNPQNINNFVDSSFSVGTLTYTNLGATYQNTLLANAASLTVNSNGSLTVGSGSVDFGSGTTEFVTIAGANSTLNVSNTNGTVYVGLGSSGNGGQQATLDLSGLGTFNATVSRFFVGVGSGSGGIPIARASGIVYLAQTNNIKAVIVPSGTESSDTSASALSIDIGDDDGNAGAGCFLYLGQTNAIFGDAIGVGRQKPTGTMQFNPNLTGNNTRPSAYFRGANATRIATWSIGDQVVNSGGTENATGTCDFTGGSVDALVNNMFVGRAANNSSGSGTANGTLTLDNGIFNVTTLSCGFQPSNSVKIVNGTINVKTNSTLGTSGTIAVSGNFNLAVTAGGTGAASSTGTLNVDGGTFSASTIICGVNGATSTINLGSSGNGGILTVTSTIGSGAAPLSALNLLGGALQLGVNGTANVTNIIATSIGTGGTTTLNIVSVTRATTGVAYPLISYAGTTDPFGNLLQGTLPAGAVGTVTDDTANSLIVITFTQVPVTPATITSIDVSGTLLNLTATGANPNSQFTLMGATNLSLPVWKPVLTSTFDGNGNLNLNANVVNPSVPQTFYRLQQ